MIVLVTGLPGAGKTTLARSLAMALELTLPSLDSVKEALVDVWLNPTRVEPDFAAGLAALGAPVREIVCVVPAEVAVARYTSRDRHPAHLPSDADSLDRIRAAAPHIAGIGLGPHAEVDTTHPVTGERLQQLVEWLGQ